MKLLYENWRRFINEQTAPMAAGKAPRTRATPEERLTTTAEKLGYYVDRKLGEGRVGSVYLVEDKETGERRAMKVVTRRLYGGHQNSEREAENYQFAKDNKGSMPEEYAKYLPDVYEVVATVKDYYIFMEVLVPLPARVTQELFALPNKHPIPGSKHERILRDPQATAEIIEKALKMNEILHQVTDEESLSKYRENINKAIKMFYDRGELSLQALTDSVTQSLQGAVDFESLGYPPESIEGVTASINSKIEQDLEYLFRKQIVPIHQGDEGADTAESGAGSKTAAVFPEAENLMNAMRYFKQDQNWQPKDVHSGNVMARPNTKDFVIVDLGYFDFTRGAKN